jgi:type IV pilus assembly protein PilC
VPEYTLKYADARGTIHQQVAVAANEHELREKYTREGFLVYSIKPRGAIETITGERKRKRRSKLNLEKFLIFNQQFVTLIKAGLPILKALELLADRLTDAKLGPYVRNVRDEVKKGAALSEAFEKQGVFPPMFVTSVMAGERSGSLVEVLERFIAYQKLALAVRKKILLSLLYPAVLVVLASGLVVFLVTYVVPSFAELYNSVQANLPAITQILIAVGTTARNYVIAGFVAFVLSIAGFRLWMRTENGRNVLDRIKLRTPIVGEVWIKYQMAQLARVLSTLLMGGIPLVQALETASESQGSAVIREVLERAKKLVKEGQSLSAALDASGVAPSLAIDMIEVGESTGALPAMLNSVSEFYEDEVTTRMTAALSLIEPAIMLVMGGFVAFVLAALYLPIFTLAETL